MRLDHLLSKEESKGCIVVDLSRVEAVRRTEVQCEVLYLSVGRGPSRVRFERSEETLISGGDALRGNTRSHPEHDG